MCFEKGEGNEYYNTDIENTTFIQIQKHTLTLKKSLYPVYCTLPPREPCLYEYAGDTQPHAYAQLEGVQLHDSVNHYTNQHVYGDKYFKWVSMGIMLQYNLSHSLAWPDVPFPGTPGPARLSQSPPACREDSEYEEKAHPEENGGRPEFQCVMCSLLLLISTSFLKEVAGSRVWPSSWTTHITVLSRCWTTPPSPQSLGKQACSWGGCIPTPSAMLKKIMHFLNTHPHNIQNSSSWANPDNALTKEGVAAKKEK